MNTCTQCSAPLQPGAAFCDSCGASATHSAATLIASRGAAVPPAPAASGDRCPECSAKVIPGQAFCENCGKSLDDLGVELTEPPTEIVPPLPSAPAPSGNTCQNCGTTNAPNHAFCDNCGSSIAQAAAPVQAAPPAQPVTPPQPSAAPVTPPPPPPPPPPPAPKKAKLVLTSNGTEFPFGSKQEILIGREDPISGIFPEVDLTYHGGVEGGVSRRHAKLMKQGEQWMAQDINSTNHTYINRRRLSPGKAEALNDGDQLRVGRLVFTLQMS